MEPFGGMIETPNINRIAERGLMYTNFHTTALCSPTRSCLLTGRNHTTNGMALHHRGGVRLPERERPHPVRVRDHRRGARRARLEHLHRRQVAPDRRGRDEPRLAKRQWPLGRGFERFYGFLGARDEPVVSRPVYDNHPVEQPTLPEEGYHFTTDLTDKAISFIRDAKAIAPDKPFFLYYCPGACHAPHHAPKEWADKYKGKFDMGYEAYRELVFERQKKLGRRHRRGRALADQPVRRRDRAPTARPGPSSTPSALGLAHRRREAALLPDGGGVRRLPQPRRPRDRAPARPPRGERRARQHAHRPRLRQRRIGRGRPERVGQREQALQRPARHDRGEPAVPRRARQPDDLQPLPDRLGVGVQHAVQALEALLELGGRHRRPADRLLAEAGSTRHGGSAASTRTRSTSSRRSTSASASSRPTSSRATPSSRSRASASPRRFDDADAETGKQTQFYSMGGTGRSGTRAGRPRGVAVRARHVGRLREAALGAVRHRERPERVPRPRRRAPGQAAGADRALVVGGGPLRRAPAREPRRRRDPHDRAPPAREAARPATSTTRAAPRSRSRSPRTSATAPTRSRSRSTIDTAEAGGVLFAHGSRFGGHALYIKDRKLKYVYNFVGCSSRSSSRRADPDRPRRLLRLVRARRRRDARRGDAHACTSATSRSARAGSRPSPASSRSPARGSTSAGRAPSRSPTTTRASSRGRSSAARSNRRRST